MERIFNSAGKQIHYGRNLAVIGRHISQVGVKSIQFTKTPKDQACMHIEFINGDYCDVESQYESILTDWLQSKNSLKRSNIQCRLIDGSILTLR